MYSEFLGGEWDINTPYIKVDPYLASPLSAMLGIKTTTTSELTVNIIGLNGSSDYTYTFPEAGEEFFVPLLGLQPAETNIIELKLTDVDGGVTENKIVIVTQPLPDDFGDIVVTDMIPTNEIHNEIYYFAPFTSYMSNRLFW